MYPTDSWLYTKNLFAMDKTWSIVGWCLISTSHCLDLDLNGQKTRRNFWCIPGRDIHMYRVPQTIAGFDAFNFPCGVTKLLMLHGSFNFFICILLANMYSNFDKDWNTLGVVRKLHRLSRGGWVAAKPPKSLLNT